LQGPNSDLYALAATFCHLVTGTTPKTSQERLSAIASRQGDPQQPVMGRAKGYPVEFLKAIDKGMSIFPRDRFQSVAEWQAMLRTEVKRRLAAVPGPVQAPAHSPTHAAPTQVPMYVAAPVMAPIPAPAATLSSGGPVDVLSLGGPAPMVETPDPTAAVKAALAAAALDAPLVPAAVQRASTPVAATQRAVSTPVPPVAASATHKPASRVSRDLLIASAAAVLLLAGLLSLPGDLIQRLWGASSNVELTAGAALTGAEPVAQVSLANGIVFETVETAHGARAMVFALPEDAETDLQVGDVLLVYAATGEMIDSAHAAQALLEREMSNGVATFGFAVQRDGKMAVGYIGLADLGKADLKMKDQDLEKKT
jgi:hypothetical protein